MYSQQTSTVKTWVFMGMAMFYVFFLLAVMKVFDGSEVAIASVKKPVESIAVLDRDDMDILGDLKPGFEQEMSSHVVRVSHHHHHHDFDYQNSIYPKLQDDSQIDDTIIRNLHATASRAASLWANNDHKLSSRLGEPMLRRGSPILQRLLSWGWGAFHPKRSSRLRRSLSSERGGQRHLRVSMDTNGIIVSRSDWATSRLR